jgi:hypothetical protein
VEEGWLGASSPPPHVGAAFALLRALAGHGPGEGGGGGGVAGYRGDKWALQSGARGGRSQDLLRDRAGAQGSGLGHLRLTTGNPFSTAQHRLHYHPKLK